MKPTTANPPPIRALLIAALAVPLLAACGGGDGRADDEAAAGTSAAEPAAGATPPAATAGAAAADPCTLMAPEEISAAAGLGPSTGQPSTSGGAQVCTWTDAEGRAAIVQVHPSAGRYAESQTAFESLYGGSAEPVPGIGDEAFYIGGQTGAIPTGTAGVRRGDVTISAQVMAMGGDPDDLRSWSLELAQRVSQKL